MIAINKIYNEDCLLTMSIMPNDFVNHCITSPPYNFRLRIRDGKYAKRSIAEPSKYDIQFTDDMDMDSYFEWQKHVINEMIRVTSGLVFYNIQMITGNKVALMKLMGHFSHLIKEIIIWDKCVSEPAMAEGVLNSEFEFILIFDKNHSISRQFDICNFKRGQQANIFRIKKNSENTHADIHAATFPRSVPGRIIRLFTNENDIIYDPFIGLGTTAIISHSMKRRFIGSEINKQYCEIANNKIESALSQTQLF